MMIESVVTPATEPEKPVGAKARLVAFHLPQFHPIPQNDAWWGKGFTEWTNVAKAKPLFEGHYQPRIPADLGFYDLRMAEARAGQAEMAQQYGIEGFCYWHYWFNGKRLLERPVDAIIASGEPNFPFCLAWANHNWTRSWLGNTKQVLLEQTYSHEDDLNHIRYLAEIFADPRYLRINGRPIFGIYSTEELPDARRTTDTFRSECVRLGLPEPYLVGINTKEPEIDSRTLGCDSTIDMQPKFRHFRPIQSPPAPRWIRGLRRLKLLKPPAPPSLQVYDFEENLQHWLELQPEYLHHPCVATGWDNTARRGDKAWIMTNATPEVFGKGLRTVIERVQTLPFDERLVFINAWNEWGEGMYLEPDLRYGHGFLEEVRRSNSVEAKKAAVAHHPG